MKRISVNVHDFVSTQAALAGLKVLRRKVCKAEFEREDPDLLSMAVDALFAVRGVFPDAVIMEKTDAHGYQIIRNSYVLMELFEDEKSERECIRPAQY